MGISFRPLYERPPARSTPRTKKNGEPRRLGSDGLARTAHIAPVKFVPAYDGTAAIAILPPAWASMVP
jgi:hypothetical protein